MVPKPQVPKPSLLPVHELLKLQIGLGRRRDRRRRQRGRIWAPSPKLSPQPVYFLLALLFHHTQPFIHFLQVYIWSGVQWDVRRSDDWTWL